jgi:hypothetical protein
VEQGKVAAGLGGQRTAEVVRSDAGPAAPGQLIAARGRL